MNNALNVSGLPRYDWARTYDWNFAHAPEPVDIDAPEVLGQWTFGGLPVASPLGIAAGPLLNGKWCLYYASLGFDILTYKTVRSSARPCYEMPNLQPVDCGQLYGGEQQIHASTAMNGSWAVSFGMPSKDPEFWRRDVELTANRLTEGKLLSVSVVGSIQPGWTIEELADDYARCAKWAVDSGADVVETNFSCPNVLTADGQLFQIPADARRVAETVRDRIGTTPYLIKIGHVPDSDSARELVEAVVPYADGLAMTNSIATTVRNIEGSAMFDGHPRGICGDAIREESLNQVRRFDAVRRALDVPLGIVAVGGISSGDQVREYQRIGAEATLLATAAMSSPGIGVRIRESIASNPLFIK